MEVIKARAYVGPNIIAAAPLAHLRVELKGPQDWPDGDIASKSADALLQLLPGLSDHPGRAGEPKGFAAELRGSSGLPLCYVVARVATELQRQDGDTPQPAGSKRKTADRPQDIYFGYDDPGVGLLAGRVAINIVLSVLPHEMRPANRLPADFNPEAALAAFRRRSQTPALDQTAAALVEEADRRDIPWIILDRERRIVQLGQGRHLRRIRESTTDDTGNIAVLIQRDKVTTNQVLAAVHLPAPKQIRVHTAEAAVSAAKEIGQPVVIKPADSMKGMGITLKPEGDEAIRSAFAHARRCSTRVIVETYVAGDDHRVLVVGNQVVAVAKRLPAIVTGDGRSSVAQLVAEVNKDPRRGTDFNRLMNRIKLDQQVDIMLDCLGYTRDSVPSPGERVQLLGTANISTGGTAIDVTDSVHPDNRSMLERAARVSGLDVVGIDFITPDIGRSYREVGGAICEINASPGLRPHKAAEGPPRDVVGPIVNRLFPGKGNGRIPIAAITGTNGKTTTSRMLAHILRIAGSDIGIENVGLVTTDGVHINGDLVAKGDFAGGTGTRVLLRDPSVDAAVLETSRGGISKSGLGFDWSDVGAVLNVTSDHLGIDGIDTLEEMANLKGRVIEAARKLALLNADDPRCLALAALKQPEQLCLISTGDLTPDLRGHLEKGGLVISLEEEADASSIVLHSSAAREVVVPVKKIPATLAGAARHNIQNAMFAVGLAHGLGISAGRIAEALCSFSSDMACNPGRLNIFTGHGFTAVLDFAHNPDGVRVTCDAIRRIPAQGGRICVLTGTGNRHGEHIEEVAGIVADQFDTFVCSFGKPYINESDAVRGFPREEIPKRLAAALIARGVDADSILTFDSYKDAVDKGLEIAQAGGLLTIFSDEYEWCWDRIVNCRQA